MPSFFSRVFSQSPCSTIQWRLSRILILALIGMCVAQAATQAQDKKDTKKDKPSEEKTIYAVDGWPLKLTYYKSTEGKEAAVVVLLHPKNESRMVWTAPNGFAEMLHKQGLAVIALDLRKHGQSKDRDGTSEEETKKSTSTDKDKSSKKSSGGGDLKQADYLGMVADLEAVKKMIYEEHENGNLNMRKTAIVAPGMSAAIAVAFTANDWAKKPYDDAATPAARTPRGQDLQALVLLSPDSAVPGVVAHQVASALKTVPVSSLVVVGKNDPLDKEQAKKLFQQMGGDHAKTGAAKKTDAKKDKAKEKEADGKEEKQRHYFISFEAKLRGTELLGKKLGLEEAMANFLKENLQELKGPFYEWRDRKSRLAD